MAQDFEKLNIQWFPGHMTKAQRMIEEHMKQVDAVCEILDARIPMASRNPDIDRLAGDKPRIVVLNRTDLADPKATARWHAAFQRQGMTVLETDSRSGKGVNGFAGAVRTALRDKIEAYAAKGQVGRPMRVMVLGIPNVGKSTFINRIAGRKTAKTEDRPGVTRAKQWVPIDRGLELLDTPGVLWPKFEDKQVGEHLAFTGAVKDEVVDIEHLACRLIETLQEIYPHAISQRYQLESVDLSQMESYEILEAIGKKRGMLMSGGVVNTERAAIAVVDEFRSAKLGKITLEQVRESV